MRSTSIYPHVLESNVFGFVTFFSPSLSISASASISVACVFSFKFWWWFVGVDLLWCVYVHECLFLELCEFISRYLSASIGRSAVQLLCSLCACWAVWISFQMTTISNIYHLNKCDVRPTKCQIMKWNGHVWGIRIHVREYIIYVCDWQIIIHTWLGHAHKSHQQLLQLDFWINGYVNACTCVCIWHLLL